jgi:hypothetical protein
MRCRQKKKSDKIKKRLRKRKPLERGESGGNFREVDARDRSAGQNAREVGLQGRENSLALPLWLLC